MIAQARRMRLIRSLPVTLPPPLVPRRKISGDSLLFWFLLILHLAPIWLLPFIPTQDGPGHQALAFILRQYNRPEAGLLREYYLPNQEALPNWFFFFLMSRVLGFVSIPMAEKILLTTYVLFLPLSVRYALRRIDPRAGFLAVLSFPFLFNFMFQMGFFNFCFSLGAFFCAVGYWLEAPDRTTLLRTVGLAFLILWVYFCHPVTLAVTVATLLTLAGWRMLLGKGKGWLIPLLASLPALALMASFVVRRTGSKLSFLPLWVKLKHLAGLYSLASVSRWTIPLAAALALLFYGIAALCLWRRRRTLETNDGWLLAVAVLIVACLVAPSELSGGGFINHRMVLFPFLALIPWFATFDHPEWRRKAIQAAAAGIALAFLAIFASMWNRIDEGISRIVTAGRYIEPDHTVLFLSYAHQGERKDGQPLVFRTWPYVHAGSYIAAEKRLVDLSLYEASEDYFPIYFNPRLDPARHLATVPLGIETVPPRVDLLRYPKKTGGRIDYVLLWGLRDEQRNEPAARKTLRQLARGYEEVWTSPDGRVNLYQARAR